MDAPQEPGLFDSLTKRQLGDWNKRVRQPPARKKARKVGSRKKPKTKRRMSKAARRKAALERRFGRAVQMDLAITVVDVRTGERMCEFQPKPTPKGNRHPWSEQDVQDAMTLLWADFAAFMLALRKGIAPRERMIDMLSWVQLDDSACTSFRSVCAHHGQDPDEVYEAVRKAGPAWFRHIDTLPPHERVAAYERLSLVKH